MARTVQKSEALWRAQLTEHQFHILREAGTERAFTGEYWQTQTAGTYHCAGCDTPLFRSETKYASGCGWPSFYDDLGDDVIEVQIDRSHGMIREEILCRACGGHLGHVFPDGPPPTGKRYCVNSASITLVPDP
ncbi:MAG: peptide-methionine (R)-S-oxide reductase [Deltaproteobacteria bacterium]|nr:MAG: peptide-methionine (R)-S-oxide reductase [Deltaproteobacteria bacterium]